jgi:hypothetical protein
MEDEGWKIKGRKRRGHVGMVTRGHGERQGSKGSGDCLQCIEVGSALRADLGLLA